MTQRERWRLAVRLQQHWQRGLERQWEALPSLTEALSQPLRRLRDAERLLNFALDHELTLSCPLLQERVTQQLRLLRLAVQELETDHFPARQQFVLRDFYFDLVQLEDEFPEVRIDWDQHLLIVVTDPITLNDIALGPFSVRLNWVEWTQQQSLQALQVITDEPNAAEQNPDIIHPHVRDGELCSGDAQEALLKALQQGRLSEAFLLIRAVLTHYNPRSAYVSLENWYGTSCHNCGDNVSDDDRSYCEDCERDFCPSCSDCCVSCGSCRCLSCLDNCAACDERCCPGCLEQTSTDQLLCQSCRASCPGCHQLYSSDDLDDETGLCHDCHNTPVEESTHATLSAS